MRILAAVDDSAGSRKAGAFAWQLAQRFDGKLTLLHVIDYYPSASLTAFGVSSSDFYAGEVRKAQAFLDQFSAELGIEGAELAIEMGKPGETICHEAEERDIDHIVVGSHGNAGGVARLLLGSVSTRVASLATCPVTIVR